MDRIVKKNSSEIDDYSPGREHSPFISLVCFDCAHLSKSKARACAAFERIPDVIWNGDNDHRAPYPGDGGIQFFRKSDAP